MPSEAEVLNRAVGEAFDGEQWGGRGHGVIEVNVLFKIVMANPSQ
jgi:hypothetical protein